jgi:hypothetical protein
MPTETEINEIADNFWKKITESMKDIRENMMKRDSTGYNSVMVIISNIKKSLNICGYIDCCLGIDTRNGIVLSERKNHLEMMISPVLKKYNNIVQIMHKNYKKYIIGDLSVVKYKFHQPSYINTISLNYESADEQKNIIDITQNNFKCFPILDGEILSFILFVDESVAKYLIKLEEVDINNTKRDIWIPKDTGIYAIISSAIGEYAMMNIIDKMEIYPDSEHKEIERKPLSNLTDTVNMILNNPMKNTLKCSRCSYTSNQVNILNCKCKKAYYCDKLCQKAHYKLHKSICIF